jgi:hypothetical protein
MPAPTVTPLGSASYPTGSSGGSAVTIDASGVRIGDTIVAVVWAYNGDATGAGTGWTLKSTIGPLSLHQYMLYTYVVAADGVVNAFTVTKNCASGVIVFNGHSIDAATLNATYSGTSLSNNSALNLTPISSVGSPECLYCAAYASRRTISNFGSATVDNSYVEVGTEIYNTSGTDRTVFGVATKYDSDGGTNDTQFATNANGAISGVGWVFEVVVRAETGTGSISAPATLSSTGRKGGRGTGTLSDGGALTSTGRKNGQGTGTFVVPYVVNGLGDQTEFGTGSISVSATITSTGRKGGQGTSIIPSLGILTGEGFNSSSVNGTGSISTPASLNGNGEKNAKGSGSITVTGTLTSNGEKSSRGPVGIAASAIITSSSGVKKALGTGNILVSHTVFGTDQKNAQGQAYLILDSPLISASGIATYNYSGTGSLAVPVLLTSLGIKVLGRGFRRNYATYI